MHPALLATYFAAFSIVLTDIPYPLHGSFERTCVTAPTIRPFCKIGKPLTSDCHYGQHVMNESPVHYSSFIMIRVTVNKMTTEIHIVLIPIIPDSMPPAPAPTAKIRIIPKRLSALRMAALSRERKYCERLSVPLLKLPMHMVLA